MCHDAVCVHCRIFIRTLLTMAICVQDMDSAVLYALLQLWGKATLRWSNSAKTRKESIYEAHQSDIWAGTAQSSIFIAMFRWCCDHLHQAKKYRNDTMQLVIYKVPTLISAPYILLAGVISVLFLPDEGDHSIIKAYIAIKIELWAVHVQISSC